MKSATPDETAEMLRRARTLLDTWWLRDTRQGTAVLYGWDRDLLVGMIADEFLRIRDEVRNSK